MSLEEPYEGQKFTSFDVLKKYLEEYGQRNFIKFWIRSSHTINSTKSKSARKLNPDLKYVCMKFACIFGGEKIRCRGSGVRKSTTYRNLGCPCMINAVVGEDGNHVKLETVILEHNHTLCKPLYDSIKNTRRNARGERGEVKKNQNSVLKKNVKWDPVDGSEKEAAGNVHAVSGREAVEGNSDPASQLDHNENAVEKESEILQGEAKRIGGIGARYNENFHNYLKNIQRKYGSNIKIIVVSGEGSDRGAEMDENRLACEGSQKTDGGLDGLDSSEITEVQRKVCRLCLSTSNKLSPIFKPSLPLESTILSFKIMSCASIEIRRDDDLPSNICSTCEEILDIAYNFRLRCENSDSVLRKASLSDRFIDARDMPDGAFFYTEENREDGARSEEETGKGREVDDEEADGESWTDTATGAGTEGSVKNEEAFLELNADLSNGSGDGGDDHEALGVSCPICGNVFDAYPDVLNHIKEHSDIENFLLTCNLCGLIFTSVKSLLEHVDEHLTDNGAEWTGQFIGCSRCELRFQTAEDAKLHEESHAERTGELVEPEIQIEKTNNAAASFLCNVCGKILKSKDRFQSHRNTHEGLRPHICLKCGRGFADRKNMHQHYDIVHLRKAKHECPICHKKFYAPTKMKSHITMHYGVKPFSCDICGKTFRLKMNMIKHKKTHSNERPHKCDKCSAAFIDKNLLTRHSYVHGGIRPYVCQFCGHRFTVKFNLKKHMGSGRCNMRKAQGTKDSNDAYEVDEWGETSPTEENLPRVDEKCDTNDSSEFSQESLAMNEYEEKH